MRVFISIKSTGLLLVPIVLATAVQANDSNRLGQIASGNEPSDSIQSKGNIENIQALFADRDNLPDKSGRSLESDPVKAFRPFNAPFPNEQNTVFPKPAPARPIHAKAANAIDSFRPFSEPASTEDEPPAGSTLNSDGHKDKLFNPQLSAHSNTQYRSTTGYVLGKTGKLALRYGPRILRYIHY